MRRRNALLLALIWVLVIACTAGATTVLLLSGRVGRVGELLSRYARLEAIRSTLVEDYYQEVDEDALIEGAIRGMMDALEDPYTFYYTPDELQRHDAQSEGIYSGLGILVQNNADGEIEIIRVYEGGPADAAGAQAGDRIVAVDGVPVSGGSAEELSDAVDRMRGESGSTVELQLRREGELLERTLTCGDVHVSNVNCAVLEGNIGYIEIYQFSGDDAEGFRAAMEEMQSAGVRGLVVDLRNNPGGLLTDVVEIADLLLPEGTVVYVENRAGERITYSSDAEYWDVPLVVLINGMSASASEILAAAVQDFDRGTLVGTRSYGKGIVQSLLVFESDGAGMQYTSATYYTPSGRCIHGTGVSPDIVAEAPEGYYNLTGVPDPENDVQLKAALEQLEQRMQ
ncbi:MAG: S41 family peptidase [Clostridia bacterium]|nr:S41 family peptidase [Clostridia bacterium]